MGSPQGDLGWPQSQNKHPNPLIWARWFLFNLSPMHPLVETNMMNTFWEIRFSQKQIWLILVNKSKSKREKLFCPVGWRSLYFVFTIRGGKFSGNWCRQWSVVVIKMIVAMIKNVFFFFSSICWPQSPFAHLETCSWPTTTTSFWTSKWLQRWWRFTRSTTPMSPRTWRGSLPSWRAEPRGHPIIVSLEGRGCLCRQLLLMPGGNFSDVIGSERVSASSCRKRRAGGCSTFIIISMTTNAMVRCQWTWSWGWRFFSWNAKRKTNVCSGGSL